MTARCTGFPASVLDEVAEHDDVADDDADAARDVDSRREPKSAPVSTSEDGAHHPERNRGEYDQR